MKLNDIMTTQVKTVTDDMLAEQAWHLMNLEGIHHLVVKRGSEIIGIISERDLGGPNGSTVCEGHTVGDLMVRDIVTASPEMTVKLAANLLKGYGIGCLPIINNGELVGIVTISDLLDLLASGLIPVAR